MMITHLITPAKAIHGILLLTIITAATTTAVGSTTRNIVRKNEEVASSSSSSTVVGDSSSSQQHRSLMLDIELNEMMCNDSLETDGSIICAFRIMPPTTAATAETTTTSSSSSSTNNPNTLVHDCLMGAGSSSNFCLTAEVHTYDQANHQQSATAAAANNNPPPPPTTTTTSTTNIEQQQQKQQQQQDCPTYKPQSGSQCGGWISTGASERNCIYGENRCDCNGDGMSEASSIIWICDGDLFGDNTPMTPPIVTIDATLSSAVIQSNDEFDDNRRMMIEK